MNGYIVSIKQYSASGCAGEELSEARLAENSGLEGDYHATGGERQLSILIAETREQIEYQETKSFCLSRFKENITIGGIDPKALKNDARLAVGEAEVVITGETKHCYRECPVLKAGRQCPLRGMSLFAKVAKSGNVRAGDTVSFT